MAPETEAGTISRIGRISRSAVGRATGRYSRIFTRSLAFQAAGKFFKRQLWAWPIVAAVILGLAGWWVSRSLENALRDARTEELNTIVDADVEALRVWMREERDYADLMAKDEVLQGDVEKLLKISEQPQPTRALLDSPSQQWLRDRLSERMPKGDYSGFFVVSPSGMVIAADQDAAVGHVLPNARREFFDRVLSHGSAVSKPHLTPLLLMDVNGELRANLPTMFCGAAVRVDKKPIAALGLRIRPEGEFTNILATARAGKTGETYAFDGSGRMLSNSRFDEDLKRIGLLADLPDSQSTLTLELRNPGVDMMKGERPSLRRADQPLTGPVLAASQGASGINPDGYADYRGTPVVGAWRWLPEYDLGVVAEMDVDEAFRPVYLLRRAFLVLMTLLALAAVGIFVAMLVMARQQKALQAATLAAKQLGQYTLEDKLGAGGMGTVYRARHAMLRRPTAIKLLDVEKISDAAIIRFEREVQLTAGLTHPNTIAVYDYGRTPDGIFYYAMEYLEGINLDDLVQKYGPLPEARALHLLRQICGSLAEAHAAGLVHRDIKPANIILTIRGGVHDFVKVLDFGLAKATESHEAHLTSANAITGTPLYISPEGVNAPDKVDATSDVYAIGAVAYFLLTGSPVFSGSTVMEICMKHVQEPPESPGSRMKQSLSAPLEALILQCLAKPQRERPKNAGELCDALNRLEAKHWTEFEARAWWQTKPAALDAAVTVDVLKTLPPDVTMAYDPATAEPS